MRAECEYKLRSVSLSLLPQHLYPKLVRWSRATKDLQWGQILKVKKVILRLATGFLEVQSRKKARLHSYRENCISAHLGLTVYTTIGTCKLLLDYVSYQLRLSTAAHFDERECQQLGNPFPPCRPSFMIMFKIKD